MSDRFVRIELGGRPVWARLLDNGGAVPVERPGGAETGRALDAAELAAASSLPLFFGEKVVGLAYNFRSLVGVRDVYDEPLIFLKSPRSVCGPEAKVFRPRDVEQVWVEVEQAVVVGATLSNATPEEAEAAILGYTIGSDITAVNVCGRDHHLARSKARDGFAPLGPWLVRGPLPASRRMTTRINGKLMQDGETSDRILDDVGCLVLASRITTLVPGDVVLTGTPAGAMQSLVAPGDQVEHVIDGIGTLTFSVI